VNNLILDPESIQIFVKVCVRQMSGRSDFSKVRVKEERKTIKDKQSARLVGKKKKEKKNYFFGFLSPN